MTRPILTARQIKKMEALDRIKIVVPVKKGGEVRIPAYSLLRTYAEKTLGGTPIKNISTRIRDFMDFVAWCGEQEITLNDDLFDAYDLYLKTEKGNGKNTIWVKLSHIRSVFRWAETDWDSQDYAFIDRVQKGMIGRAWKYKVRGKPFQKKENSPKPTLPTIDPRKCLPYIEEVEQPKPKTQPKPKRGNPFRKTFLYDLLGVAPTATNEEIKRGYKKRMVAIHPDHNTNDGGNYNNLSQGINLAFEYLSRHRADYDGYCATNKGYEEAAFTCKDIYAMVGGYSSLYKLEFEV